MTLKFNGIHNKSSLLIIHVALKPTHLNSGLIPPMKHACYATIDDKTPVTIKQLQRTSTLVLTQGLRLVTSLSTRVTGRSLTAQVLVACSDSTLGEFSSPFGTLEAVIALVLLALQSDQTAEEGGGRPYRCTVDLVLACFNSVVALGGRVGVFGSARHCGWFV